MDYNVNDEMNWIFININAIPSWIMKIRNGYIKVARKHI